MQKIPVDKALKGMVLAKPVARESGVILMGEGTDLSESLIGKLKDLEIQSITVKGRPLSTGEEKTLEQIYDELESRFTTVADDKFCNQIKDMVKKCLKRRHEESEL